MAEFRTTAGILGNSITEMKVQDCAYLHIGNNIIIPYPWY